MRKALNFEPVGGADDANRAGRQAAAIQVGSSNVALGYASWLEAGQQVFVIITTLLLVAGKSPAFALSIFVFIVLQLGVTWWQSRAMRDDREEFDTKRNVLVGRSQDIIGKRDVILAHEQGGHYEGVLKGIASEYGTLEQRLTRREEVYRGMGSIVTDSGRVVILGVALIVAVTTGSSAISGIGDAYFLIAIYFRLLGPAQSLIANYADIRRSQQTSREFLELLAEPDAPPSTAEPGQGKAKPPAGRPPEAAVFRGVYFTYPSPQDDDASLVDTSFSLMAGRTNLIVGRSGSGKTTIARILLGFLRPDQGEVVVEGRPLEEWTPAGLRLRMSYVPQSDQIVDDSVRANFSSRSRPTTTSCACSSPCTCRPRRRASTRLARSWTSAPSNSRAESSSGWRSPGCCWTTPTSSSSTNRSPASTRSPSATSPTSSRASWETAARPLC